MAKKCIKMNSTWDRRELTALWLTMPLWALFFPLTGIFFFGLPDNLYVRSVPILASFFCFLHLLHLTNNKFEFRENGIRLAGVDHRIVPYANIKSVQIDSTNTKELMITFTPLHWLPGTTTVLQDEARQYEAPSAEVAQEVVTELSSRIESPAQIT